MGDGEVEERAGRYGFRVGEAFHIRPIFLEAGRAGRRCRKYHPAAKHARQNLVEVALLTSLSVILIPL
jgi:hypothetical protein